YINVSRGGVAQGKALLAALTSGQVSAAGLGVYADEPLGPGHPVWTMPQVLGSPHYSGEGGDNSARAAGRFARELRRGVGDGGGWRRGSWKGEWIWSGDIRLVGIWCSVSWLPPSPRGLPPRDDDWTARRDRRASFVSAGLVPAGRRLDG